MNDLEAELARLFAEPVPAGEGDLAGRVRSILRARVSARRSLAIAGAGAIYAVAVAASLLIWKLAATALPDFEVNGSAQGLIWLPFVAAIAIVALAARCTAAAIVRLAGARAAYRDRLRPGGPGV